MYRIGLTGGIASGKSTVVAILKSWGAAVIDCDILARQAAAPGSDGLIAVRQAFGPQALLADGTMDRAYIGSIVFQEPSRKKELEDSLFPFIHRQIADETRRIEKIEKRLFLFLDMPLLFEVKYHSYVDEAWLVYVDPETQLRRLMARNNFTEREALARIQAQLPIDEKRSLAQVIIDNAGSLENTKEQVRLQWDLLMSRIRNL